MTVEINKIKTDGYNRNERVVVPPVDIFETENEYLVKADMPGVKREDIDITLDKDILSINGTLPEDAQKDELRYSEYSPYNFSRSFNVGRSINSAAIQASVENGVLTVTLPKKEEIKPKKIEIMSN